MIHSIVKRKNATPVYGRIIIIGSLLAYIRTNETTIVDINCLTATNIFIVNVCQVNIHS